MNTPFIADQTCEAVPNWQSDFLANVLPVVISIARYRFRNLRQVEREEATAEAVAGAMVSFVRLVQRGRSPTAFAGRLAKIAVLRVLEGRSAASRDNSKDAMSRYARRRRGFTVESIEERWTLTENGWETRLVEYGNCTPADLAASRLDFAEWLNRMKCRRRQIVETLAAGYRTEEVARLFNLSHGRISQLRREFEASWKKFQGE